MACSRCSSLAASACSHDGTRRSRYSVRRPRVLAGPTPDASPAKAAATTGDLQLDGQPALVERGADRAHLVERALDELLATEARTDAHDQDEIDRAQMREHGIDPRLRVERDAGAHATGADRLERARHVV